MPANITTFNPNSYEPDLDALAADLHGQLLRPVDGSYSEVRTIWNGAYQSNPGLIVRCADVLDVARTVKFAREHDLPVSIRSGGHSMVGHGTVEGGLMIDLSLMNGMEVDPERQTARIQPGRTWGEVAAEAQKHGLALSSGDMATVGVGGLTVGGGIGWMVRKYGLTIDHLLSVEVVTADGHVLVANREQYADLFWALRGGGGNFGIITSFEFQLRPVPLIVGGAVFYDAAEAETVLRKYRDYATTAPDELTTMATVMHAPPAPFIPADKVGTLMVAVMVCYAGDIEEGMRVVAPLRELGTPVVDLVSPMPYPVLFEMTKEGGAKGAHHDGRSMYLPALSDRALDTIITQMRACTSPFAMAQLRILGGAMSRVPESETAFAHRDKLAMLTIINFAPTAEMLAPHRAWGEGFWKAMRPHASGVYVNFLGDEGEDRIREAYKPATYERLVAVKNRYDPTNFFRLNQNIKPTVGEVEEAADQAA